MTTYGNLTVQGIQLLPNTQKFTVAQTIPFSNQSYNQPIPLAAGTNTYSVPTGFNGVIFIPALANGFTAVSWGASAGTVNHISPTLTSIWTFDPAAYPTNVVITTVTTATAYSFLQFF